jgi:hypothetical protein
VCAEQFKGQGHECAEQFRGQGHVCAEQFRGQIKVQINSALIN